MANTKTTFNLERKVLKNFIEQELGENTLWQMQAAQSKTSLRMHRLVWDYAVRLDKQCICEKLLTQRNYVESMSGLDNAFQRRHTTAFLVTSFICFKDGIKI